MSGQRVRGTLRHDFDEAAVRGRLETADADELRRLLDEALHVVSGLREAVHGSAMHASEIERARESQWMGPWRPGRRI